MFVSLMHMLRAFMGQDATLRLLMTGALVLTVLTLAAWLSPAFRDGHRRWRDAPGWRGGLAGTGTGLFKVVVLFILVRLLVVAMRQQAEAFEQRYGRVTETNRSAVLMKWGCPHEQRELEVNHTRTRTWVTRQLKPFPDKSDITTESFWKDEAPPVQAVEGRLPAVISVREEERDVDVPQKSIVSADISVGVRSNPRQLGRANYAGYDDAWSLDYVVANASAVPTTARFRFPLPASMGLFDDLYLRMDGSNVLDTSSSEDAALTWSAPMAPGGRRRVEIGYRSRGLEHLRYIPRRMSQTGHYRVALTLDGVPAAKLDYPIGSMPPAERLDELRGSSYELTWKLDNALTSYDIGIKLPLAEQPRYHYSRLMREAPVGLLLLLTLLVLPRLILGVPVRVGATCLTAVAYFLLYTLMGHLADVIPGFVIPFAHAAALMVGAVAWFRMRSQDDRLLRIQDVAAFAALAVLYPLAVIDAERTSFWLQVGYVAILLYVFALVRMGRMAKAR